MQSSCLHGRDADEILVASRCSGAETDLGLSATKDPPTICAIGINCLEPQPGQSLSVSLISSQLTHNMARPSEIILALHLIDLVPARSIFIVIPFRSREFV